MQRFPQALFRAGGAEVIEGRTFTSQLVHDEAALDAALADGWYETADEADALRPDLEAAKQAEHVPTDESTSSEEAKQPTRAELEAEAKALGVTFRSNTSDATLTERIAAKRAEQGA